MKKIIPLLLLPLFAHAEVGVGEYFIDAKNPKDVACDIAENLAVRNALRIRNGETIESSEIQICALRKDKEKCEFNRVSDAVVGGTIDKIVDRNIKIENGICKVQVDVTFKESKFLNVNVSGNNVFRKFDNITFNIQVAQPTYLYIFNVDEKNSVKIVFPFKRGEHFKVNKSGVWPNSYSGQFSLLALLNGDIEIAREQMIFVFTQHPIQTTADDLQLNQFVSFLDAIPIESKRVFKRNIVITK
jgi:hypothetical protein